MPLRHGGAHSLLFLFCVTTWFASRPCLRAGIPDPGCGHGRNKNSPCSCRYTNHRSCANDALPWSGHSRGDSEIELRRARPSSAALCHSSHRERALRHLCACGRVRVRSDPGVPPRWVANALHRTLAEQHRLLVPHAPQHAPRRSMEQTHETRPAQAATRHARSSTSDRNCLNGALVWSGHLF